MNALAVSHFAQDLAPVTPLPAGPTLRLPSGDLSVMDNGRVFFYHQWVIAVGVSANVFLVIRERDDRYVPARLLHELLGYLTACNCEVFPLDYRFPVVWRQSSSFAAVRVLWAAQFFGESDRLLFSVQVTYANRPAISLPLKTLAEDAAAYWYAAGSVADALASDVKSMESSLRPLLARISVAWERRWNETLSQAEALDCITEEARKWIQHCDRVWSDVFCTHLEPFDYEMQAASLARLL